MVSSRGQEIFISSAFLRTFDTVFRDTLQLSAMFRSLKFRLWSLMISRYLVMVLTLLIMYLHQSVYDYSIRNLCNGFHKSGIMISLCRNDGFHRRRGGSVLPEVWLPNSGQVAQWEPEYSLPFPFTNEIVLPIGIFSLLFRIARLSGFRRIRRVLLLLSEVTPY